MPRILGRPYARVESPDGAPTAAATLGAGRRAENAMERLVATIGQLERLEDDVDRSALIIGRAADADRPTVFARVLFVFGFIRHNLAEHMSKRVSRITKAERVPERCEPVPESIGIRLGNRSGEATFGPVEIDLADRGCRVVVGVESSVGAGDEAETPEGELRAGDESDCEEVDRGHQTCGDDLDNTPYLARQLSVFVTGNKIYMVGCRGVSLMVAQDARNETQGLDRFGPSRGGNTLRPVCGCVITVVGCGVGWPQAMKV